MVELYGISENVYQERIGGDFKSHPERSLVATFGTRRLANAYVKKVTLKKPRDGWCCKYPYRQNSLLSIYNYIEIEEYVEPESVPHNPQ